MLSEYEEYVQEKSKAAANQRKRIAKQRARRQVRQAGRGNWLNELKQDMGMDSISLGEGRYA